MILPQEKPYWKGGHYTGWFRRINIHCHSEGSIHRVIQKDPYIGWFRKIHTQDHLEWSIHRVIQKDPYKRWLRKILKQDHSEGLYTD